MAKDTMSKSDMIRSIPGWTDMRPKEVIAAVKEKHDTEVSSPMVSTMQKKAKEKESGQTPPEAKTEPTTSQTNAQTNASPKRLPASNGDDGGNSFGALIRSLGRLIGENGLESVKEALAVIEDIRNGK